MHQVDLPLHARSLTSQDAGAFADLYSEDPYRYLTLRMNLEVFGYESETVNAWGAFTPDNSRMLGVMLRYSNTAIVADGDGATAASLAPVIDAEQGLAGVRGSIEVVQKLRGALQRYVSTGMEASAFLQLIGPPSCPQEALRLTRKAGPEDLDLLTEMYAGAWSMYRSRGSVATKLAESRVYVVEEAATSRHPRRIVSCALLNIESQDAGLIGGVYTRPAARGKGYAAACTAALSLELQGEGKLPCLFYENPIAGRIYRRLGFEEIARWAVLYIRE